LIPRSLLLIDADPAALGYLSGLLQRDNRQIQQAPGSKEALDLLRAGPFDLVLAGEGNNGFDGLKLLRRVRSIRPATKVILTGDPEPQRILAAIRKPSCGPPFDHSRACSGPRLTEFSGWSRVIGARNAALGESRSFRATERIGTETR